jgi:hypothetical protein
VHTPTEKRRRRMVRPALVLSAAHWTFVIERRIDDPILPVRGRPQSFRFQLT